jgi:hypothetical protein
MGPQSYIHLAFLSAVVFSAYLATNREPMHLPLLILLSVTWPLTWFSIVMIRVLTLPDR